jgi:tripartite-type tricarboxylate transporter receptor subunit TctC
MKRALQALSAATLLASTAAFAQGSTDSWPSRPVTIIVPLSPGATVDIETRLYANELSKNMSRNFVVDFKPGAGTTIGLSHVAKAAPDGYTLVSMTASATIAKLAYPNLSFDPIKDLAPISLMSMRPIVFVVHPSMPVKSLKEYIAYAKANPMKVNAGTAGAGGLAELGWGWFNSLTDTKVTLVHYKGGGPAFKAVLAGEVDIIFGGFSTAMSQMKAGKLRALGTSMLERSKLTPDLPTAAEQGLTGFNYFQWIGIAAPAATPQPIIARMNTELARVAKSADVQRKLEDDGTILVGTSPERFRQIYEEEAARWRKVARDINMKFSE